MSTASNRGSKPRLLDLSGGHVAQIDELDWPLVRQLTLYRGTNGYVYYSKWENGRSYPRTLHSLLVGTHRGKHVDHINGDKLDNRRENLRVVTPSENQVNRKELNSNNTSGIRGVQHVPRLSGSRPWRAQITINRKNFHLGLFETQEEAVAARREAEFEHFGSFCP